MNAALQNAIKGGSALKKVPEHLKNDRSGVQGAVSTSNKPKRLAPPVNGFDRSQSSSQLPKTSSNQLNGNSRGLGSNSSHSHGALPGMSMQDEMAKIFAKRNWGAGTDF